MDKKSALKIAKSYVKYLKEKKYDIEKAYLFGSFVKGNFSEDSDIDLAIVMSKLTNSYLMQVELMKLSRKIDSRIEPHPFDDLDFNLENPFAKEILQFGVKLI